MASYLSAKSDCEVTIEKLRFYRLSELSLENLRMLDHRDSLLLEVAVLKTDIGRIRFREHLLKINSLVTEDFTLILRKYESDSVLNLTRFLSAFASGDTTASATHWQILCGGLEVINGHFVLQDLNRQNSVKPGINFNNLDLDSLNAFFSNINLNGDTVSAQVSKLEFKEHCGLRLTTFESQVKVCPVSIQALKTHMVTNDSELDMDLVFHFDDYAGFSDFLHDVTIESAIRPSSLAAGDLAFFVPSLGTLSHKIDLSGEIKGPVSNLKIRDLYLFYGSMTNLYGDISMTGLPEIQETYMHMKIKDLNTCIEDIQQMLAEGIAPATLLPENLQPLGTIHVTGRFTGFINDFVSFADFRTDLGAISTDLELQATPSRKDIQYKGKIFADQFDLGTISQLQDKLGKVTLGAQIQGSGTTRQTATIQIDGTIDSLDLNNHRYQAIYLNGLYSNEKFIGKVNIDDPLIHLVFSGLIDLKGRIPQFDFSAAITNARLHDLGLIDSDSLGILTTRMTLQLGGKSLDSTYGQLILDSTTFITGNYNFKMDRLRLTASQQGTSIKSVDLESDYIDGHLRGDILFEQFLPMLSSIIDPQFSAFTKDSLHLANILKNQNFQFNIDLKNTAPLTALLLPDLAVALNSGITGSVDSQHTHIQLHIISDNVTFKTIHLDDLDVQASTDFTKLSCEIGAGRMFQGKLAHADAGSFGFDNLRIRTDVIHDTLFLGLSWDDGRKTDSNAGNLALQVRLDRYPSLEGTISDAKLLVNGSTWNIDRNNYFLIDSSHVRIDNLTLSGQGQQLRIDGALSSLPGEALSISFNPFNLDNLRSVLKSPDFSFGGMAFGNAELADIFNNPTLIADLQVRDFTFNSELLGDLNLRTEWDNTNNKINTLGEIIYAGNDTSVRVLALTGTYAPSALTDNFDFSFKMDNLKIKPIGQFLEGIFTDFGGYASGQLYFKGNKNDPKLTGEVSVRRGQLRVDFLNTKYIFSDNVYFEPDHIGFKQMNFHDTLGNTGMLDGKIFHRFFKDFKLDLAIQTKDLLGINTTSQESPYFYGTGVTSGTVTIKGPGNNLAFDIRALTERGTAMYLPISYTADVSDNPYIVFVNKEDTLLPAGKIRQQPKGSLDLNMEIQVTDDATIHIFLPNQMGNIKVNGEGLMRFNMPPAGDMGLSGTYVMEGGTFYFTLRNLISRTFHIRSGSTISWTGDMFDADINLKAVYQVKPSLSTLPASSSMADSSLYSQRIPVDCVINLNGDLFNPTIRFGLEMPDVQEESIRTFVYNSIDTTNEAQLNQQMISLLVLNSFSLNTGTGVASSMGLSSYDLLANQLNSWLSQISDEFDIGVNYQKGDAISPEQLEVALSTQLFNDRVTVNGNFGVGTYKNSEKTSSIVGDVLVEVRITRDGRFRVRAYNKTNTYDLFNDNAPYTQGVGVSFRSDFNRVKDIFNRKRKTNKPVNENDTGEQ
ncbi:MAG TPA: translocation/assembly module TamB domain-containing protein [Bacteroidales bacterium]|nr:translocation/assembly module TamB domain-containing protein [Bacteroidales bacterium]